MDLTQRIAGIFDRLELPLPASGALDVRSPITQEIVTRVPLATAAEADEAARRAHQRFLAWREVPAPARGHLVRTFGELVREHKAALGELVSIEVGKIRSEGLGEVQEVVDICEFAVGLSRQLHGLLIASERPGHKLLESWHPLGPTLVISAFNFPMAVWAWNAALALVCGNTVVWKPSEKTPLSALAMHGLPALHDDAAPARSTAALRAGGERDQGGLRTVGDRQPARRGDARRAVVRAALAARDAGRAGRGTRRRCAGSRRRTRDRERRAGGPVRAARAGGDAVAVR